MRVAIANDNNHVSNHFGHCENFKVYEVEEGTIKNTEVIKNPEHKPGFLPKFLKSKQIDIIVAGGMGSRAVQLFDENGIEVYTGIIGTCDEVINKYISGSLVSANSVCNHEH